jgi:hypothetical protein
MDEMQRFVDQDLTQAEEDSLLAHIEQCPECAASFEQLQRLSAELSLLPMVSPPFSIVDSILPRLAELDAQQAAIKVAYLPTANQRKKPHFPWKIGAGFVAAAVVFSLVLVNLTPGSNKDASEIMTKNGDIANNTRAAGKADSGAGIEGTQAQAKGMAPMADKRMDSASAVQEQTSPSDGKSNIQNGKAPAEAPAATGEALPAPSAGGAASAPAATPAPALPSNKVLDQTFGADSLSFSKDQTLASDDGSFIGVINQQTVFIQTPDGKRIFTSSVQWKASDVISLVEWQDNQRLIYEVKTPDGAVKRYVMDVIEKTELEQKN